MRQHALHIEFRFLGVVDRRDGQVRKLYPRIYNSKGLMMATYSILNAVRPNVQKNNKEVRDLKKILTQCAEELGGSLASFEMRPPNYIFEVQDDKVAEQLASQVKQGLGLEVAKVASKFELYKLQYLSQKN
jgi:hypothetical protein